jgi:hypothetical protein
MIPRTSPAVRLAALAAALIVLGTPARAPAAEVAPAPGPEGLWRGAILYDPGKTEIDVLVELAQAPDGRWVGTIDVLPMGLEYQPLEDIAVEGSRVTFWFNRDSPTAGRVESPFEGELSADGSRLEGEFVEGGKNRHPFTLERIGEAGDPRPEPRIAELHPLSAGGDELREAFNRHQDAVRVVLLLSPT